MSREMPFPTEAEAAMLGHAFIERAPFRKPLPPKGANYIAPRETWETRMHRVHIALTRNMASDCTVKITHPVLARESHVKIQYIRRCLIELENRKVIRRLNEGRSPSVFRIRVPAATALGAS